MNADVATRDQAHTRYPVSFAMLHWVIASLVLFQLFLNGPGTHNVENMLKAERIVPHATIGVAILTLMVVRLFLRQKTAKPEYGEKVKPWHKKWGAASHHAFYALLIVQPIVGLSLSAAVDFDVALFGVLPTSAFMPDLNGAEPVLHLIHGIIPQLLLLLILGHIIMAIVHGFRRDGVFRRMWFRG